MSINSNANQAGTSSGQASSNQSGQFWSLGDNNLFGSPIPKGIDSEYFNKFKTALLEIYKGAHRDVEISVIEMSRTTEPVLDFSCIIVATRLRDDPKIGVAFHVLLLAKTGEEIPTYTQRVFDREVVVTRVPGDAIDKTVVELAMKKVSEAFPNSQVYYVDGQVVPANFDIDKADRTLLQQIARGASMAGYVELISLKPGFEDLDLSKLNRTGQPSADITFERRQLIDAVGNVFRSDVQVAFTDRKPTGQNEQRTMNNGDRVQQFSVLHSYLDVLWNPAQDMGGQAYAYYMPQQMVKTQKFLPRQVITSIDATYAQTVGAVLLALSTALALRPAKNWMQGFRPVLSNRSSREQTDMYDIGALNIEGNLPVPQANGIQAPNPSGYGLPVETKGSEFANEQLAVYIASLFHQEMVIAMDVPENGPQTYYLSVFATAAMGDKTATERILDAANKLTHGEFGKNFQRNSPIFVTQPERIHAGYWIDVDGRQRDIRDFDHVAVANICQRDPRQIRDWSDTYLRTDYPEIQRLDARRRFIESFSNGTAKITGYYRRVTFSAQFLSALEAGIAAHGLRVNIRTPASGQDMVNYRGTAAYMAGAMLNYNQQGFLQQGGYAGQAGPYYQYQQFRY